MLFKEFFQVDQHEAGQHGGDHLALVADHLHLRKAKIPHRDVCHSRIRHVKSVEQLRGDERQAEDDAEDLRRAHFSRDGPDDPHGQQVEDRLADEP